MLRADAVAFAFRIFHLDIASHWHFTSPLVLIRIAPLVFSFSYLPTLFISCERLDRERFRHERLGCERLGREMLGHKRLPRRGMVVNASRCEDSVAKTHTWTAV